MSYVVIFFQIVSSADEKLFTPFKFKMDEIEGFRYRSQDALRAVTKASSRVMYLYFPWIFLCLKMFFLCDSSRSEIKGNKNGNFKF